MKSPLYRFFRAVVEPHLMSKIIHDLPDYEAAAWDRQQTDGEGSRTVLPSSVSSAFRTRHQRSLRSRFSKAAQSPASTLPSLGPPHAANLHASLRALVAPGRGI